MSSCFDNKQVGFRDTSVVPVMSYGSLGDVLSVSMVSVTLNCREWRAAVC